MPTTDRRPETAPLAVAFAAALLAALATGCSGATAFAGAQGHFTIRFTPDAADPSGKRLCPTEVTVDEEDRKCSTLFGGKQHDCMNAHRSDEVTFAARRPGSAAVATDLQFSLDFDPFRSGSIPSKDGVVVRKIDPVAPLKAYTYNVYSPGCPVKDPQIVLR